jgi:hypothetical protein
MVHLEAILNGGCRGKKKEDIDFIVVFSRWIVSQCPVVAISFGHQ